MLLQKKVDFLSKIGKTVKWKVEKSAQARTEGAGDRERGTRKLEGKGKRWEKKVWAYGLEEKAQRGGRNRGHGTWKKKRYDTQQVTADGAQVKKLAVKAESRNSGGNGEKKTRTRRRSQEQQREKEDWLTQTG